jgi:hypothetical protein
MLPVESWPYARAVVGADADPADVDYVYIQSRGAHGHFAVGVFEALVGSQREIWIGSDGSGMIKETRGPVSFFAEAGRARWEASGSPDLASGPSVDLCSPGCLGGSRARLAKLPSDWAALESALAERQEITFHVLRGLLGEMLVPAEFCRAAYSVAARLPGVHLLDSVRDQLGRPGHGLALVEDGHRVELVFDEQTTELLAYQEFLADPVRTYAPVGTLVGWSAYTSRQLLNRLPEGTPPLPDPPCDPPGAGRVTQIDPGLFLNTGYFTDLPARLQRWRTRGVITEAQYQHARSAEPPG